MSNQFDHIYAALLFAVEWHYLRKYGGSFAEHFYGLKRQPLDRISAERIFPAFTGQHRMESSQYDQKETRMSTGPGLLSKDAFKSILVLVGSFSSSSSLLIYQVIVPYLKQRIDEWYNANRPTQVERHPLFDSDDDEDEQVQYYWNFALELVS